MNFILLLVLLALLLVFADAGLILPATIVFFLILADFFGGYVSAIINFCISFLKGLWGMGESEYAELESAKTKYTSGKKFIEEGLTRTGKAIGAGEKAKLEGKKLKDSRDIVEIIYTAVSDFLAGLGKVFKK